MGIKKMIIYMGMRGEYRKEGEEASNRYRERKVASKEKNGYQEGSERKWFSGYEMEMAMRREVGLNG